MKKIALITCFLSIPLLLLAKPNSNDPGVYGANGGYTPGQSSGLPTPEARKDQMAMLLRDAGISEHSARAVLPALPKDPSAYYLDDETWTILQKATFSFKQTIPERLSGGGKLMAQNSSAWMEISSSNPVFLFRETEIVDPPCIVRLGVKRDDRYISLEKTTTAGAWVRRADWLDVRLTSVAPDWYLLEAISTLPMGQYALCYNLTVVPFQISASAHPQAYLVFDAPSGQNPKMELPTQNAPRTHQSRSRYADLKIADSYFINDAFKKTLDQKNGFKNLSLGSMSVPAGFRRIDLPNIGVDNHAQNYNPVIKAFGGATSVSVRGGKLTPGTVVQNTEYFMGGMGRARNAATNVWIEAVEDPDGIQLYTRPAVIDIFPNDVDVYAADQPRIVNGVTVTHLGLNYIGGRLAGIVMQYDLNDEAALLETFTAAFGKGYRDSNAREHRWKGDRVSLKVGQGYIRYSSLPILQAIAGFLPDQDAPSKEDALDTL